MSKLLSLCEDLKYELKYAHKHPDGIGLACSTRHSTFSHFPSKADWFDLRAIDHHEKRIHFN